MMSPANRVAQRLLLSSFVATVAATCWSFESHAAMFCSEPSPPYCVDSYGPFDDEYDFDSCRREVENFVSDVGDYADCLADARNDAVDEANEAVRKFNRRAQGY